MPSELVEAVRSELLSLHREGRTWTVSLQFRVEKGKPIEARVRGHEMLRLVPLST